MKQALTTFIKYLHKQVHQCLSSKNQAVLAELIFLGSSIANPNSNSICIPRQAP